MFRKMKSMVLICAALMMSISLAGCTSETPENDQAESAKKTEYEKINTDGVEAAKAMEQISDHIWMMPQNEETDRPNLFLVIGEEATAMIDAGNSEAQVKEFYSEIRKNELLEPDMVLLTHWHWDHSFGSAYIPADVYAHPVTFGLLTIAGTYEYTDEAISQRVEDGVENAYVEETQKLEMSEEERKNLKIRVPDKAIEDGESFDLGGVTITAEYVNCDQSDDMIAYYVEEDDMLLIGDIMYEDYYHGPDHFSRAKVQSIIDYIQEHPSDNFYGAHTDGIISKQELIGFYENILDTSVWEFRGESWETVVME